MVRARFPMLMICFFPPVVCGTAYAEPTLKLYDLRDLVATVPVDSERTQEERIKKIVENLVSGMNLTYDVWLPGIYSIQAEDAEHVKFRHMLNQFRELFEERYEVEIVQYTIEMADVPSIGDEVSPASFVRRQRLVTTRRTPTPVEIISRHTFVSEIVPVVANGAVGYAPETDQVDEGLRVSLLVGAGEEYEKTVSIHLFGNVRQVVMGKMSGPLADDRSPLQLELPVERSRSIQSNPHIPFGKLTVLAVTAGFDGSDSIVIAAMVRKLEDPDW